MSSLKTSIGVLGGGQLGRMIALEGRRMGFRVIKWTGGDVSGAAYTADQVIEDPFDSPTALTQFIEGSDAVTVEFENIPVDLLEELEQHLPVRPSSSAVAICQNRLREKTFLEENGFPCARFAVVENGAELVEAMQPLDSGAVLKTAAFGYDGKGQIKIAEETDPGELESIWNESKFERAVLEEFVPLAAELSVLVARTSDGQIVTYDPAENVHRNHILDYSIVPARLPEPIAKESQQIAAAIADALGYQGLLAVEFFLSTDGRLLVNELAPRPHNSGHHTFDACHTSQFEQLLRVVAGLPLGSTALIQPVVMWNLMGELWDVDNPDSLPDWTPILKTPGAKLHLYGKSEARLGRKMGHATFLANTLEEAIANASECRKQFGLPDISPEAQLVPSQV